MSEEQQKIQFGEEQIQSFAERIRGERAARAERNQETLSFGISFFDECLNGIGKDLVLVGASSGVGKTELATHIALTNAAKKKRVHYFALEAEEREIEQRIKFKYLADMCFKGALPRPAPHIDYADWYYGKYDSAWGRFEPEIDAFLGEIYASMNTIYRTYGSYTADDFARHLLAIQSETDLVVIDHFHYFDFEDQNENRAMKETVKKIRDLALLTGKPIILVAHVRKTDKRARSLIPSLEDFHGTSDIGKIGTKAVMLAPAHEAEGSERHLFPTYMRAVKFRQGSYRTRMAALCNFDISRNAYENSYRLGRVGFGQNGTEDFYPIYAAEDLPRWAVSAKRNSVS